MHNRVKEVAVSFRKMWYFLVVCGYFARGCLADISAMYYCASMNPQGYIIIPQLMGMWYAVEILDHTEQRHYNRIEQSCPIIHISEDFGPSTENPLYRDYKYGYNYGQGHGYQNPAVQYGGSQQEINQRNGYGYNPVTKKQYHDWSKQHPDPRHYIPKMKYLRLYWDENGQATEYHLKYNVTWPGFWQISEPEADTSLDVKDNHFKGTIQVIKAVGNHMVLTFCYREPHRLYSVLLSREVKLDSMEIHGVHSMLNRKGLGTNAVKKVCNTGSKISLSTSLVVLSVIYRLLNLDVLTRID